VGGTGSSPGGAGAFPGEVTGRVAVGRYVLTVGAAAGTKISLAPEASRTDPWPLANALSPEEGTPPDEAPTLAMTAEQAVDDASAVTAKTQRALDLFAAVAEGRLDPQTVSDEVDALIALLGRLDREGRHAEELRLARALSGLLALTLRWVALVQSLRTAWRAARALADSHGEAWALHELGTLSLGADQARTSVDQLEHAREMRSVLGDERGLVVTDANLALARARLAESDKGWWTTRRTIIVASAAALVLAAVGVGLAIAIDDGNSKSTTSTSTHSTTKSTSTQATTTTDTTPPSISLTGPPDGSFLNTATPTFSGVAGTAPGDISMVTVDVFQGRSASGTPAQSLSASVGNAGSYAVQATTALAEGDYVATASQKDAAGNVGSTQQHPTSFTIDLTAPTVTITSPDTSGSFVAPDTFAGAAGSAPGDGPTITVKIYSGRVASGTPVETLSTTASGGNWSVKSSSPLTQGATYTVMASQRDKAGNTGSDSVTFVPPTP